MRFGAAILAGALWCAAAATAANYGNVQIIAVDASGAGLQEVRVEASSPQLIGARVAHSNPRGEAVLPALPPGTYLLRLSRQGFEEVRQEVRVVQDRTTVTAVRLKLATVEDAIEVTGDVPIVDLRTPSTAVSHHVTLAEVEPIPVGRDYRAYVQLAPGVNVVPNSGGIETRYEPASKAGNFYHDRGAALGSRDNTYFLDGFNLTGFGSGGGDLTFNNEAILEEEVITSGVPAEYTGGAGFVANILTKSGGPALSGSLNLHIQKPWMYEDFATDDTRLHVVKEDKYDAGFTLGGPVLRDRMWFFVAAQQRENSDDVELSTSASPVARTERVDFLRRNAFAKVTAGPTVRDTLVAQYYSDPRETTGTRDVNTPPNRYSRTDDTPRTASLSYQRLLTSSLLLDARWVDHEQVVETTPQEPSAGPVNTVLFPPGHSAPAHERLLGSSGAGSTLVHRKDQGDLSLTGFFSWHGSHQLKAGLQHNKWQEAVSNSPALGFTLTSLAAELAGITFAEGRELALIPPSEYDTIFRVLAGDSGAAAFRAADANGDGLISDEEFGALSLSSTEGNPGGVNFLRNEILHAGVNNVRQDGDALFLQDDWRVGRFSLTLGLRVEDRRYVASDGSTILDMDPAYYPRLGLAVQLPTSRPQTLSFAYGVYPDPLRSSMIRFAGNLSGSIFADQIFIGDDWYSYRFRGQADLPRDAGFAPNMENEEETEYQLTYGIDLSPTVALFAQAYYRRDDNIIEDYDPRLYFDPAAAGSLVLSPGDFGYPPEGPGSVNYFLANLVGAKREARGLDLALQRRFRGSWGANVQYSWKDAEGNSNSDAAADLQGDFLDLDPRQPHMWGDLPGTIEHQVKVFGSYRTPFHLEIGGLFYWNSGAVFTEATSFRPTTHAIYYNYRRSDGSYVPMGAEKHPGYHTLDLRLRSFFELGRRLELEVFLDIYNALDEQDPIRVEEAHNDPVFTTYREARLLLEPRRYYLGARLSF